MGGIDATSDAAAECIGVCKHFGAITALESIDLRIPTGRTTVLIGPSGCGKSTLLRVLVGLVAPDGGELRLRGVSVSDDAWAEWRPRIGYVIQSGGLFPHLTVAANVALLARHRGWADARIRSRIDELLVLVRLDSTMLTRYPRELSGGQRQRVSLMRALMLDPELLLLDEPLGALDPLVRADLQDDLRAVFRALKKTVVLVTHDLAEATFFADHLVLLNEGRIAQRGTVGELIRRPADGFVERFVRAQRTLSVDPEELG